ncbi:MAG: sulfotransferase [Mycobacteriales bacterium]
MIFVAGLHRSGTSLLARALAGSPGAAGLVHTGVPEDEGQHLQTVYPPARVFGGPGRFALSRHTHLTEKDASDPARIRRELEAAWQPFWSSDGGCVHVEKSPPNLVRLRYLQAIFPGASFVIVVRHPIPVAMATRKMSNNASLPTLMRNWFAAHQTMLDDLRLVDNALVVTYHSLVAGAAWPVLRAFTDLDVRVPTMDATSNQRYIAQWHAERFTIGHQVASLMLRRRRALLAQFGFEPQVDPLPAHRPVSIFAR